MLHTLDSSERVNILTLIIGVRDSEQKGNRGVDKPYLLNYDNGSSVMIAAESIFGRSS